MGTAAPASEIITAIARNQTVPTMMGAGIAAPKNSTMGCPSTQQRGVWAEWDAMAWRAVN